MDATLWKNLTKVLSLTFHKSSMLLCGIFQINKAYFQLNLIQTQSNLILTDSNPSRMHSSSDGKYRIRLFGKAGESREEKSEVNHLIYGVSKFKIMGQPKSLLSVQQWCLQTWKEEE